MDRFIYSFFIFLGNIRFIGELFKFNVVNKTIIHICIRTLLRSDPEKPNVEDIEQFCILLENLGKKLEVANDKLMEFYFEKISVIKKNLPNRYRFMVEDLVELRKNKWERVIKQKVETPQNSTPEKKVPILKSDTPKKEITVIPKSKKELLSVDISSSINDFEEYFENEELEDLDDYLSKNYNKNTYTEVFAEALLHFASNSKKFKVIVDLIVSKFSDLGMKKEDFPKIVDYVLVRYLSLYRDIPKIYEPVIELLVSLISTYPDVINCSVFNKQEFLDLRSVPVKHPLPCVGAAAQIFGSCCEDLMETKPEFLRENMKEFKIQPAHYLKDDSTEEDLKEFFNNFNFGPSLFKRFNPVEIIKLSLINNKSCDDLLNELKEATPKVTYNDPSFIKVIFDGVSAFIVSNIPRTIYKKKEDIKELIQKESTFFKDYNRLFTTFCKSEESCLILLDSVSSFFVSENCVSFWAERIFHYFSSYKIVDKNAFLKWRAQNKTENQKLINTMKNFF